MDDDDDRLRGKVAALLNKREIAINLGAITGAQVGMRFAVLNPRGADIKDPDSGEVLGSVELVKAVVKVVRVEPQLCVARTFRVIQGQTSPLNIFQAVTEGRPSRYETLTIADYRGFEDMTPEESRVKVGDPVVEARGDEYADDTL